MHKKGWSIIINELWDSITVRIYLQLAICNSSDVKNVDLNQLGKAVTRQLKNSYEIDYIRLSYQDAYNRSGLDNFPGQHFSRKAFKKVRVFMDVKYRLIGLAHSRSSNEMLLDLKPDKGHVHTIYGEANKLGGSDIILNVSVVPDIINGNDLNTIAHEFGHTLGLYHVNDVLTYKLDGRQYFTVKRQHTRDSLNVMFSGDSRFMHNLTSTVITPRQNGYYHRKLSI